MRRYLLSHKYQTPALVIFIIAFLANAITCVPSVMDPQCTLSKGIQFVLLIIQNVSLLLTCFSAEKQEDEFFTRMRLHSGAVTFVAGIVVITILNLIQLVLPETAYLEFRAWRMEHFWNGNLIIFMMLLYYILFKIQVHKLERRMNDEE